MHKQAPTLFSFMFTAMITDAYRDDEETAIKINYRTDGGLFNLQRLKAKTKTKETAIRELLYADDCALYADSIENMQISLNKFSAACNNFGFTINTKKTEVMHQSTTNCVQSTTSIYVNQENLQVVENFTYLGSTLSNTVHIDTEINNRIAKASAVFGRLRKNVWERRGIKTTTKLKVYQAAVVSTLLYACETWTVYARHAKKLNHFHLCCLRKLLNIHWWDKVPDYEVLKKSSLTSIYTLLLKAQVRWAGHLVRMNDFRLPKRIFYGELQTGRRKCGGQKKRYKDTLKSSLKHLNIDECSWESIAQDRTAWRYKIRSGAQAFEEMRQYSAEQKRIRRKDTNFVFPTDWPHSCQVCGRNFHAHIGLLSHLRTHHIFSSSS